MPTFGDLNEKSQLTSKKRNTTSGDEVKLLKAKVSDLEDRYKNLIFEHERSHIELEHEKRKVSQLETQLKFVKDNQAIFEKLREAYINMKYNEATGRKLVEIRDKCVQTWDGVLCRACLDTEKLRHELEQTKKIYDDCVIVKRNEIIKINTTIQTLKNYVNERPIRHSETHMNEGLDLERKVEQKKKLVGTEDTASKWKKIIKREESYIPMIRTLSVDRTCFKTKKIRRRHTYKRKISMTDLEHLNCLFKKLNF